MPLDPVTQFRKYAVEVDTTAVATEAYVAVWANRGRGHVIIGAPTLQALEARWEQITNLDFDPTIAQRVFVCVIGTGVAKPVADDYTLRFAHDWT